MERTAGPSAPILCPGAEGVKLTTPCLSKETCLSYGRCGTYFMPAVLAQRRSDETRHISYARALVKACIEEDPSNLDVCVPAVYQLDERPKCGSLRVAISFSVDPARRLGYMLRQSRRIDVWTMSEGRCCRRSDFFTVRPGSNRRASISPFQYAIPAGGAKIAAAAGLFLCLSTLGLLLQMGPSPGGSDETTDL